MNFLVQFIGALGGLGVTSSTLLLFICWCNYIIQAWSQQTLKPKLGLLGRKTILCTVATFLICLPCAAAYVVYTAPPIGHLVTDKLGPSRD
jgi:hypothetical protein